MENNRTLIKPGFFLSMVLGFVFVYYAISFILLVLALVFNSYVVEISDTYYSSLHLSKFQIILFLSLVALLHLTVLVVSFLLFRRVSRWLVALMLVCMMLIIGVQMLATGFAGYQKYIAEGIMLALVAGLFLVKSRLNSPDNELINSITDI